MKFPAPLLSYAMVLLAGNVVDLAAQPAPRATLGDTIVEPKWDDRLNITVGHSAADIVGTTDKAIQAAVDYVARFGGGTVTILPGTYRLRNSVFLKSNVRLRGSGTDSVLLKEPSVLTTLAADSDWFDQEITLSDAAGFQLGDGVCLRSKRTDTSESATIKRTLVARSGNRFKLDQGLRKNFWRIDGTTVESLFPIIAGEGLSNIVIERLTLDGNRDRNGNLDGNHSGCIFLQECNGVTVRQVTARNNNGDGISWQVCHDVVVEDCVSEGHAGYGVHPGSGSQRTIVRNNQLAGNRIGLFFCWGVRHGLAENNQIERNEIGISIGHHDTDNVVRNNNVAESRRVGLLFRPERGPDFAGHRNRIENNRLLNNGPDGGFAVDIQGGTESIVLAGNEIVETRGASGREAIRLGPETKNITLRDNRISGFDKPTEGSGRER